VTREAYLLADCAVVGITVGGATMSFPWGCVAFVITCAVQRLAIYAVAP
jgi:hypothetical protein